MSRKVDLVLFDLGNVIFEVDFMRTWRALGVREPSSRYNHEAFLKNPTFDAFERGQMSKETFYEFLDQEARRLGSEGCEDIETAWNACLPGVISGADDVLDSLKKIGVPFFALSNACQVHVNFLMQAFSPTMRKFNRVYASYELGFRKPEAEIYQRVVDDLENYVSQPERILFIDDREENLRGAETLGIQVEHCKDDSNRLKQIIKKYIPGVLICFAIFVGSFFSDSQAQEGTMKLKTKMIYDREKLEKIKSDTAHFAWDAKMEISATEIKVFGFAINPTDRPLKLVSSGIGLNVIFTPDLEYLGPPLPPVPPLPYVVTVPPKGKYSLEKRFQFKDYQVEKGQVFKVEVSLSDVFEKQLGSKTLKGKIE